MYNDLVVLDEHLHVRDIDDLKVQKENLHVHSINDIENLKVQNNCLHVHYEEYHHNFTCSEYNLHPQKLHH